MWEKHQWVEKNVLLLAVLTLITVSLGGIVQILPLFTIETTIERVEGVRPYSPLELAGRDVYVREGCYLCHSQQIRTFRDEVERYGHYSLAAESMYDHPFQWGSKRNGPDLARVGGRYSNGWHAAHLTDPRSVVPDSIMPRYGFLAQRQVDAGDVTRRMRRLRQMGVPYTDEMLQEAVADLLAQNSSAAASGAGAHNHSHDHSHSSAEDELLNQALADMQQDAPATDANVPANGMTMKTETAPATDANAPANGMTMKTETAPATNANAPANGMTMKTETTPAATAPAAKEEGMAMGGGGASKPVTAADIDAEEDATGLQKRYPKVVIDAFTDSPPGEPTEMDALIAYLQMLGTLVQFQNVPVEKLVQ